MEAKEQKKESPLARQDLVAFFGGLKQEFKNISWTPHADLLSLTRVVVIATFIFGMAVYLADLCIQACLKSLAWLVSFF